jgi:hypothetical protein
VCHSNLRVICFLPLFDLGARCKAVFFVISELWLGLCAVHAFFIVVVVHPPTLSKPHTSEARDSNRTRKAGLHVCVLAPPSETLVSTPFPETRKSCSCAPVPCSSSLPTPSGQAQQPSQSSIQPNLGWKRTPTADSTLFLPPSVTVTTRGVALLCLSFRFVGTFGSHFFIWHTHRHQYFRL